MLSHSAPNPWLLGPLQTGFLAGSFFSQTLVVVAPFLFFLVTASAPKREVEPSASHADHSLVVKVTKKSANTISESAFLSNSNFRRNSRKRFRTLWPKLDSFRFDTWNTRRTVSFCSACSSQIKTSRKPLSHSSAILRFIFMQIFSYALWSSVTIFLKPKIVKEVLTQLTLPTFDKVSEMTQRRTWPRGQFCSGNSL